MDRERVGHGITGALFFIGLGVIWLGDWWWPGIMVVLGLAAGAGLAFRGSYRAAIAAMIVFFGIPLVAEANIPWNLFGPMVLIGIGVIIIAKAFFRKEPQSNTSQPS